MNLGNKLIPERPTYIKNVEMVLFYKTWIIFIIDYEGTVNSFHTKIREIYLII